MAYWCDDRALDMEQRGLDADQARAKRRMEAAMTKLYRATNPQQIIDVFERRAGEADKQAANAKTAGAHNLYLREAYAWRAAADILRQTDFAGWDLAAAATLRDPDAPPITKADYDWKD